ncbi:MAG: glycine zipper 2TM domain-containing protein [Pseudomonadales bacterium]
MYRSIIAIVILTGAVALPVRAAQVNYEYAPVVAAKPLYETVRRTEPEQRCWEERVVYQEPRRSHYNGATGTIVGGLIGAAIGNAVGHRKSNQRVGAVAGGLLGASIGHDVSRRSHGAVKQRVGTEQRCEVVERSYEEQQLVGYQVKYRYHGKTYSTRMDRDPGERVKLRVQVSPVY